MIWYSKDMYKFYLIKSKNIYIYNKVASSKLQNIACVAWWTDFITPIEHSQYGTTSFLAWQRGVSQCISYWRYVLFNGELLFIERISAQAIYPRWCMDGCNLKEGAIKIS